MKNERTFVIVKPDGVQRSYIGEIIGRIERTGLKIVYMNMTVLPEEKCWSHYNKDDKWFLEKGTKIVEDRKARGAEVTKPAIEYGKDIIGRLVKFMTVGPVVVMVVEGNQAVGIVKKLVGGTEPMTSDVGTIRGDLTLDSYALADEDGRAVRNLIHCSDKPSEAEREISLWIKPEEIISYKSIQERMLYDVNIDGILE
jgi:nucleoside-diphosphate kinase